MIEERENISPTADEEDKEYPYNLLTVLKGQTALVPPDSTTEDRMHGLHYALSTLEEREQTVICRRFVERKARSELGRSMGISPEVIRQIERKAIRKLRHSSR